MPGCRLPGPLGPGSFSIEDGTLCRSANFPPRSLGLEPLAVDQSLIEESRRINFQLVIRDALRKGARDYQLELLASRYLFLVSREDRTSFDGEGQGLLKDWAHLVIEGEKQAFEAILDAEMSRVSALVGVAQMIADRDDYRYRVRPLYYEAGFSDPASFLSKVKSYRFLNKFEILIHIDLATILDKVGPLLEKRSAGLTAATAGEIGGVLGIQIRKIAGSSQLSNHAFGLAIDIDAYSNPHVVNRNVIEALNWVVQKKHPSFDFGKEILSQKERGHSEYTTEDVNQLYQRALPASEEVKAWLQKHHARYKELRAQAMAGEKELGLKKVKTTATLEDRAKGAEAAKNSQLMKKEADSPSGTCEVPSPDAPEVQSADKVRDAAGKIAADENLRRIQVLYENIEDTKYIDTWEKRGVLTVPRQLAAILVGELGLRWGEQYKDSKDAMHFELMGKGNKNYYQPDNPPAKGAKPMTLSRILQEAFVSDSELWKLALPDSLKPKARKR